MNLRPLMVVPPVALGVVGFLWMTSGSDPAVDVVEESAVAVRTKVVNPQSVIAEAIGYGRVEAERTWSAVSEVQGRVAFLAEGIAEGTVVEEGQVLVVIDQSDYELSRKTALANIAAAEAQLAELTQSEDNARRALEVQESILAVAQAEFERVQSLVDRGTSTQAMLDTARRNLLAQEANVTNLDNTLALYPSQREAAEAALQVRRAELAEAESDLEKTTLTAPFRARAAAVNVDQDQFVRTGDTLLTLDGIDAVEITAEVQPASFGAMINASLWPQDLPADVIDTTQAISLMEQANIRARVSLTIPGSDAAWPAEIVRMRGVTDSETGAMGLVVRVADPLLASPAEGRPPLNAGTFATVTFAGPQRDDLITVPRDVLQYSDQGAPFVYLSDGDNRLQIQEVETGPVVGADIVVRSGLTGGETLVLSDPRPPIPGLLLDPVPEPAPTPDS